MFVDYKDYLKRLSAKYLSQWFIKPLLPLKPLMLLRLLKPLKPLKPLRPLRLVKLLENSQLLRLLKSIKLNNIFGKKKQFYYSTFTISYLRQASLQLL